MEEGKVIGTCGHELEDVTGVELSIKEVDKKLPT